MTTDVKLSRIRKLMEFYDSPEFNPAGHRVDADVVFKPMDGLLIGVKWALKRLLDTPGVLGALLKEQPPTRLGVRHPDGLFPLMMLAADADNVKAPRLWYWERVRDVDEEWGPPQDEKMLEESILEWLMADLEKRGVKSWPPLD